MRTATTSAGFTLLELLVTITILSVLLGFANYSWNAWADRGRLRASLENYHSLFAYARWAAASHRQLVTVCPLSADNQCTDDWQRPISVFIDHNNDKQPDENRILRQLTPGSESFDIRSRTGGRGYFQFNSEGMIHGATGSLVLCPGRRTTATMVYMALNKGGRFRVQYDEDGDNKIRLNWGATITC